MFEAGTLIWRIQTIGKNVLKQDLQESEAAANKAGESLSKTAKQTEEVGKKSEEAKPKVKTLRQELLGMSTEAQAAATGIGRGMLLIGAAILATTSLTVKAATEWETAWTGVTKTIDAPADQLERIEAGLRGLTRELPASHEEIAAVAEAAGQLGVAAENVVSFTRTMIDLGETTNLTSDEAATSLAQLMNIFQTAPDQVHNLGSAIVALGNNGASTERDIVQMSLRIAGAAKIIGLSEGQTLGLANALASVGIEAEAGGSSVSNIMIDIANAVSSKGSKLLEWAKLAGLSADEFAEKYRTKPAEALTLVIEGMGRLNAAGGDVFGTLSALGQTDVRVTRSLLGLAGSGDVLRKSLQLGNDALREDNALQVEAAKRYETTAAKIAIARNSVVDMAIDLGQFLLPAVQDVASGVSDFTRFIGDLPEPVRGALVIMALFTAGIVLAGGAMLIAVPKIVAFRTSLALLTKELPRATAAAKGFASFLSGGWGLAIAAAALGLDILNQYIKDGQTSASEFENALANAASAAELLKLAAQSDDATKALFGDYADSLKDLPKLLDSARTARNSFGGALNLTSNELGAIDSLDRLGDSLGTLAGTDLPSAQHAFRSLADEYHLTREQQLTLLDAMPGYRDALVAQATAMGINVTSADEAANNTKLLELAMGSAETQATSTAGAYLEAANRANQLDRELDQLISTLNKANSEEQDAISANADYQAALADVDEAIRNAQAGIEGYSLGLDENTENGSKNLAMLADLAAQGQEAAESQYGLTHNTDEYIASLQATHQAVYDRAIAFGATADEAQRLADKIASIPTDNEIKILVESADAQAKLDAITRAMDKIRSGTKGPGYFSISGGVGDQIYQADGGRVTFFANGGENHQAQFARAGDYRVWAEPETGGEWYIPAAPSKRVRSTQVLAEAADEFGFQLVPKGAQSFADGGRSALAPANGQREVLLRGEMELVNGKAYITGIIEDTLGGL